MPDKTEDPSSGYTTAPEDKISIDKVELIAILGIAFGRVHSSKKEFWDDIGGFKIDSLNESEEELLSAIREDQWKTDTASIMQALESLLGEEAFDKEAREGFMYSVSRGMHYDSK